MTTRLTSIIVASRNGLKYTKECLGSIKKYTHEPHELIIVDNNSKDEVKDYLKTVHNTRVIFNKKNLGFGRAINQGMRIAKGDYILWLNNDVIITTGWLEKLIRCAVSDPIIGAVGPCTNGSAYPPQLIQKIGYSNIRELPYFAEAWTLKYEKTWEKVTHLIGFCLLLKRNVMERVGLLDEAFGPGGYEDSDYCLRIRQAGYKIMFAKDVYIHHYESRGYVSRDNYDKLLNKNLRIFTAKWGMQGLKDLGVWDYIKKSHVYIGHIS